MNSTQTVIIIILSIQTALFTYVIYKLNFGITKSSKQIVLDTSAVIDGRILNLANAGFLNGSELISTNLILDELQYLADEGDSFKRSRARYGLEVLNKLAGVKELSLTTKNVTKSDLPVDQQLLNLASNLKAPLFTADFNLAERAKVEGVVILSPQDLSEALKPQILPGESFKIKLIQKGDDRNQAVGYLPDGTMVVAENLQSKIGQVVELKSSKIIQTTAGRIVFAQSAEANRPELKKNSRPSKPQSNKPPKPNSRSNQNNQRRSNTKEDSLIEAINNSK